MKKILSSTLNRLALIVLVVLVLVLVAVMVATTIRRPTSSTLAQTAPTPEPIQSGLGFVDGEAMSGDTIRFSTNTDVVPPLELPLKTRADFAATESSSLAYIETTKGTLTVKLYPQQAPLTVANFIALAQNGFYDDLRFHRVEPGFVVQIGDPASRGVDETTALASLGTGYPGYRIEDEFGPGLTHDRIGVLSMANINATGEFPNTGGSQFFITLAPATHLDGRHAIFGQVTEGLDVLEKIQVGDAIEQIKLE